MMAESDRENVALKSRIVMAQVSPADGQLIDGEGIVFNNQNVQKEEKSEISSIIGSGPVK